MEASLNRRRLSAGEALSVVQLIAQANMRKDSESRFYVPRAERGKLDELAKDAERCLRTDFPRNGFGIKNYEHDFERSGRVMAMPDLVRSFETQLEELRASTQAA